MSKIGKNYLNLSKIFKKIKKINNKKSKLSKFVKIVQNCQSCQKLWKLSKLSKIVKVVKIFKKKIKIVKMLVRPCFLITLIKCPKGHKSLGSLCSVVNSLIVSLVGPTNQGTRSPIELLWTAKKDIFVIY